MNHSEIENLVLDLEKLGWSRLINLEPEESVATKILGELESIFGPGGLVRETSEQDIPKEWQLFTDFIDLTGLQLIDLWMIATERDQKGSDLVWQDTPHSKPTNNLVLQILTTNLSNTLLAVKQLVLTGFDAQAKLMLRWFVELADTTTSILDDHSLYKAYITPSEDFETAYKHWRTHLTPKKVKQKLLESEQAMGWPPELVQEFSDMRDDVYKWLSQYAHANWGGQVVGAHAVDPATGAYHPCIGGMRSESAKHTLIKTCLYCFLFLLRLQHQLAYKHNWKALSDDKARIFWMYRGKLLETFFIKNYATMKKFLDT